MYSRLTKFWILIRNTLVIGRLIVGHQNVSLVHDRKTSKSISSGNAFFKGLDLGYRTVSLNGNNSSDDPSQLHEKKAIHRKANKC